MHVCFFKFVLPTGVINHDSNRTHEPGPAVGSVGSGGDAAAPARGLQVGVRPVRIVDARRRARRSQHRLVMMMLPLLLLLLLATLPLELLDLIHRHMFHDAYRMLCGLRSTYHNF